MGDSTFELNFQNKFAQQIEVDSFRSIYMLRDTLVKNNHLMDRSALLAVTSISSLMRSAELKRVRFSL